MTVLYTDHREVDSSALTDVWYDAITQELYVKFHAGNFAGYKNVTPGLYNSFVNSDSVGRFYGQNLRNNVAYPGINTALIDDEDFEERPTVAPSTFKSTVWGQPVGGVGSAFSASVRGGQISTADVFTTPVAPAAEKRTYHVVGIVAIPQRTAGQFQAGSMEEAVRLFKEKNGEGFQRVTEVREV